MSGYDKNQEHYAYDSEATRPNQVPTYAGIAQPSFASQYPDAPTRLSHEPANLEMPFIPSSTYESRATTGYQAASALFDARSRHRPSHTVTKSEITKYVSPSQGTAGSTVLLHIRTSYDLAAEQPTFVFMFGKKRCVAALQKVDQDDEFYNYALSVEVPPFPLTNSWNPTMMLKLQMEDKSGQFLSEIDAGNFTFTDMSPNLAYQSSPQAVKKRKYSGEYGQDQDYMENAAKRTNSLRFHAKPRSMSVAYSATSLSPLPAQSALASAYEYSSGYDLAKQASYTPQLPQKSLYAVPSGLNMGQADMKPLSTSQNVPSYNQYGSLAQGQGSRLSAPMTTTSSRQSALPGPASLPNPILVRATVQQSGAPSSGQPFNPYLMYSAKAVLKIEGDLDKMTENWTRDERDSRRRLVEFKRSQHSNTITTNFAPVMPEARPARSICVSCIWWEEKDEYFITSVDTIMLLEALVNVRFTVEEKNRIRRNLEGFRPLTVSKAKSDSEEFFKVIMGFPNPKPRNIEKDVKVFPWKILSHALKKIISKYSASYASTAGPGSLPGASSSYVPVGISQTAGDAHRNSSPRSVASSAASTAYTPSMTSTSLSPNPKSSAGLEASAAHGLSASQRGPLSQGMTQWGATAHHQVPQYSAGLSQGGRESWDYGYMGASASAGVPAAQSMHMQRSDVTPDLNQLPADSPYQQYGQRTTRV